MITIADLPEVIEDLRKGDLRVVDVEYLMLDLFVENDVADILPLLPDDVEQRVRAMLHETFAGEASEDDIMIFDSARGMHPHKAQIVSAVRRWLREEASELPNT